MIRAPRRLISSFVLASSAVLAAISFASAAIAATPSHAWTEWARRLTGESSAVRARAIAALRARRSLSRELEAAFGTPDQFLAFDAISALGLKSILPELLKYSARDESGFSYHAINSILDARTGGSVAMVYAERVVQPGVAPAARMALIDSLARTDRELPPAALRFLAREEAPEVRESLLNYLRLRLRRARSASALELAHDLAARDPARQVREQAQALIEEIEGSRVPEGGGSPRG